ncbi:MAG: 50S ribosomal protein L25/general stress protein Ctc [Propionibacteriaceae bacterium]|jgi:large subunit ribosomal protein L25|nr:50S ribosomal protein L25/general stress protein Ctc [Propionibacteriaceae bacterium]
MADNITLEAVVRTEFGKGASRRLRRGQRVPAVLYGHGIDPIHVALPSHATQLALRHANQLLTLDIPGDNPRLALPKQVQRNPVTDQIEHVDLILVRRGERVTVEIPLVIVGEVRGEAVIVTDQTSILVEAEATSIPSQVEINVADFEIGAVVVAGDLKLPDGVVFSGEADDLLLSIQAPQAKDRGESAEAEAEADQAAGEDEAAK